MTELAQPADAGESGGSSPRASTAPKPVRDGVLLGLAVGVSGLAFGAAAVSAGLTVWQTCALSLLAYTGASQFALAGTIAAGGSLSLYSLRLSGLLQVRGAARLLAALGVTDESTALALAQPDNAAARTGFFATFASLYLTWNAATLAGAIGAGKIGSPQSFGLDVIAPAAFLALIWPRLAAGWTDRGVAAGGAAIAIAATPLLPPGAPIILAGSAALAGTLASRPASAP